jgi:hypothetical protein
MAISFLIMIISFDFHETIFFAKKKKHFAKLGVGVS